MSCLGGEAQGLCSVLEWNFIFWARLQWSAFCLDVVYGSMLWRFTAKNLLWPEPRKVQVQPLAEIVGYSPGISPSASTSIVLGKCLLSKYTKVLQQPLVICSYKPVLLGGSTFGKLVTANWIVPALEPCVQPGDAGCLKCLRPGLDQSVASVLQAFFLKPLGTIAGD